MGQDKVVAIIDYGMGNVRSVAKAFEMLGAEVLITDKKNDLQKADLLVLPGVGAFGEGMANLKKRGLIEILNQEVLKKEKPILGICLGMQLLAKSSEEFGKHRGLGWLDAEVKKFDAKKIKMKIPHVGWNDVRMETDCPLFKGVRQDAAFYFVHSYYMVCKTKDCVAAVCNYGMNFTAAVWKENIFATQFHPEKSQNFGLKILKNFLEYKSNA